MASKIDVSALTLNAEEAQNISEAVMERVFVQGELADVHDIQTGIQHQKQIVFIANLDVGGEALSGCTPAEQDSVVHTEKFWTPALIAGRFTHCANDVNALLKLYKKAQRVEPDFYDRVNSEELGVVMAKVIESLKVSVSAKAWLSDTAAAVQPGGNFTIGGFNAGLWDQFDGLWKQIFADGAIPVYTISENGNASFALQVLAAGESQNILQNMYTNADSRLVAADDAQILVTRSIWDNWLTLIETKQAQGGIIERLENGSMTMSYRGIPMKLMNEWDRTIRKYQNDLTVHFRPHRALMTVPTNIPIGTLNEDDMQTLESFYDQTLKSNFIDYGYFLDAKHGEAYLSSAAY